MCLVLDLSHLCMLLAFRKLNIVDAMFKKLEKYSSDLETIVTERTKELEVEKRRVEDLLSEMLPGCADTRSYYRSRLINGDMQEYGYYKCRDINAKSFSPISKFVPGLSRCDVPCALDSIFTADAQERGQSSDQRQPRGARELRRSEHLLLRHRRLHHHLSEQHALPSR